MVNFTIEFGLDPAPSIIAFLESLNRLITGSVIKLLKTDDGVTTSIVHHADGRLNVFFCYELCEEHGQDWRNSVTIIRSNERADVRVEAQSLGDSNHFDHPKKPAIIDALLDCFGSAGGLPFKATGSALIVNNNDSNFAHIKKLVTGTSHADHPVIYVTKNFLAGKTLEPDDLAQRLYGIAYVWVERDKHIGKKLRNWLARQKIQQELWPGSACLYWPEVLGSGQHLLRLDQIEASGDSFLEEIEKRVLSVGVGRQSCNKFLWSEVNRKFSSDINVEKQGSESSQIKQTDAIIAEEAVALKKHDGVDVTKCTKSFILYHGKEQDTVKDEALEMVLDAIEYYLKKKVVSDPNNKTDPCRRTDVLQAILEANKLPNPRVNLNQQNVKSILSGTRKINSQTESALKKIGICVTKKGKHPKLIFGEKERYVVTAASSSSDVNGWCNLVAEINRKFF